MFVVFFLAVLQMMRWLEHLLWSDQMQISKIRSTYFILIYLVCSQISQPLWKYHIHTPKTSFAMITRSLAEFTILSKVHSRVDYDRSTYFYL